MYITGAIDLIHRFHEVSCEVTVLPFHSHNPLTHSVKSRVLATPTDGPRSPAKALAKFGHGLAASTEPPVPNREQPRPVPEPAVPPLGGNR